MRSSIGVLILFFVVVGLNCSGLVDSLGLRESSNPVLRGSEFGEKINLLKISIVNDLPPGSAKLYFKCDYLKGDEIELKPGEAFGEFVSFSNNHNGAVRSSKCSSFTLYSASGEGDQLRIYWSVREDGIYHSYDNAKWILAAVWSSC